MGYELDDQVSIPGRGFQTGSGAGPASYGIAIGGASLADESTGA